MNRKFALFIVIALLTSLVWVSSVLAAPETTMNVCVTLEGSRAVAANEPAISYQLTKQSGGTVYAASGTSTVSGAPSTVGCFDVVAEPGEVYDVKVWGADTLTASVTGFTINDGVTIPLTLREGDINSDNVVDLSDFALLGATWNQSGVNLDGDLNEEGSVDLSDFALMGNNWNQAGSRDLAKSTPRVPSGTATVRVVPAADYSGSPANTQVHYAIQVTNGTPEDITGVQIELTHNASYLFLGVKLGSDCNGAGLFAIDCTLELEGPGATGAGVINKSAVTTGGDGTGVTQNVMVVTFLSLAPCTVADCIELPALVGGDAAANPPDDGTLYTNSARAKTGFANCVVGGGCASATAIALSSNVAAPSQSVATIVLVFVASALVIGSRFAVLNKRK